MSKTIKSKQVSYGTVEIRESHGGIMIGGTKYSIYVNGSLRDSYDSLDAAIRAFDRFY